MKKIMVCVGFFTGFVFASYGQGLEKIKPLPVYDNVNYETGRQHLTNPMYQAKYALLEKDNTSSFPARRLVLKGDYNTDGMFMGVNPVRIKPVSADRFYLKKIASGGKQFSY